MKRTQFSLILAVISSLSCVALANETQDPIHGPIGIEFGFAPRNPTSLVRWVAISPALSTRDGKEHGILTTHLLMIARRSGLTPDTFLGLQESETYRVECRNETVFGDGPKLICSSLDVLSPRGETSLPQNTGTPHTPTFVALTRTYTVTNGQNVLASVQLGEVTKEEGNGYSRVTGDYTPLISQIDVPASTLPTELRDAEKTFSLLLKTGMPYGRCWVYEAKKHPTLGNAYIVQALGLRRGDATLQESSRINLYSEATIGRGSRFSMISGFDTALNIFKQHIQAGDCKIQGR